jgi:hypothetical protein
MRDRTGPPPVPVRRRFVFHAATSRDGAANAVVVAVRGSAGDPTAFGGELVVRNAAGSGEGVVVPLPAAGWVAYGDGATPSGYRFTALSPDHPVSRIVLRANRLRIRAGGETWAYTLDELAQGALGVRLRLGTAMPWCALAPAKSVGSPPSTAAYDRVDRFVAARNTPPPASCPPF